MDIALVLESLLPACQYGGSLTANTEEAYNNIRWNDERTKPTWVEVQAEWESISGEVDTAAENEAKIQQKIRELAISSLIDNGDLPADYSE